MSQQDNKERAKHFYRASAADFKKIPGSPIAYWVSDEIRSSFQNQKPFSEFFFSDGLTKTGDNEKYLRFHWEVSRAFACDGDKYRICVKGGDARDYYGNIDVLVKWTPTAREHYRKDLVARITPEYLWQSSGISWTKISSKGPTFRWFGDGMIAETGGPAIFSRELKDPNIYWQALGFLASKVSWNILTTLNPTLNFQTNDVLSLPFNSIDTNESASKAKNLTLISKVDWNYYETSWEFSNFPLLISFDNLSRELIKERFISLRRRWLEMTHKMKRLEEENNRIFIDAYGLQNELTPDVPLSEITLTCNPHYRYGSNLSDEERENRLQSDTIAELISYTIGCMMGRYSLDREGIVYAHSGNVGFNDLVAAGAYERYAADSDGILPLTSEHWFDDDVAARVDEFVRSVWGADTLEENLQFIADSLCLYAIKPAKKGGETARETIRRYLSTQFFKDHLKTYKKRPIYWLFSSGKEKAFECLVYLHRYNESTLPRMRTEYVTPLLGQMASRIERLNLQKAEADTAEAKRISKDIETISKQLAELRAFDDQLKHYADMKITLDLDDGVKVNYGKFGNLLAEVKAITGDKGE